MKYVIGWKRKRHGTTAEYEDGQRRVMALMRQWKRPEGVTIHQWVVRAGGDRRLRGRSRPTTSPRCTRRRGSSRGSTSRIEPVLDIDVALAATGQAIEWRDAAV